MGWTYRGEAIDVGSTEDAVVRVDSPTVRIQVIEHTKGLRTELDIDVANGNWLLIDVEDDEGRDRPRLCVMLKTREPIYE